MPTTKTTYISLLVLLVAANTVSADWWNYDWEYKKPISINSSMPLVDYQIAVNVSYVDSMQDDFDDLRFTDLGEIVELSYWVEYKQDSEWAYVWVKVGSIDSSNGTQAYMYYGNDLAHSSSSCADTFAFCDDFSGDRLDWANKWQSNDQELYYSSVDQLYCSNASRPDDKIETKDSFSGYVFESRLRTSDVGADGFYMLLNPVSGTYFSVEGLGIANNEFVVDMSYSEVHAGGSASEDTYYILSFRLPSAGIAEATVYSDNRGDELFSYSGDPDYRVAYMGFLRSASGKGYVDWALVREYSDPEPLVSLGDEVWMNSPPDDPSPALEPEVAYADSNISCTATYLDPEGDEGILTFDLSVNGEFAARCPPRSVVDDTELECSLLSEIEEYGNGDVINCTVTAEDNNSQQTVSWVSLTVQNSPPTMPTRLTPAAGVYSGALAVNCSGSADPDDDFVYYEIQTNVTGFWEDVVDGDSDGFFLWVDASGYDAEGVEIRCRATDLSNTSEYYDPAGTIGLDNTMPSIRLNESVSDYLVVLDRLWASLEFYSNEVLGSCLIEWDDSNESADVLGKTCVINKTDEAGNHTFRAWASDLAGNWNNSAEYWVHLDTTTTTTTTTTSTTTRAGGGGGGGGGGTNPGKPKLSCFDGIKNQGEKGVDCGGPCAPCPSCDDGIQNQGESGIDCGGSCAACKAATTTSLKKAPKTTTTLQAATTTTNARILVTTTMADVQSSAIPLGLTEGTILFSALALIVISIRIHKGKL
jgi:hypothetical protein